ncbi:kelch-like protein 25 [Plakobranchus ocellatus]|uniref:Kelch-like protein 25 n=1 Tax=Plakobranchus ocellatus TaxID=259542 RepID=A0AAV4DLA1_9GAST|nr:kelch-like protein 25 [Plakobranchus ocellatus]
MESTEPCPDETIAVDIVKNQAAYRDNSSFSDVTVVMGGIDFQCHRVILAAASPFFKSALMCGLKEDREGKVTLESVDVDIFSNILTCIYCGEISLTEENLLSVWEAAHMLQINFILRKSEEFFRSILRPDNFFEFFFRVRLISEGSHQFALEFMAENFDYLRQLESFNSLEKKELKCLISSERLEVAHEDDLIESLLKWVENDPGKSNSAGALGHPIDQPEERLLVGNIHAKSGQTNVTRNVNELNERGLQQPDHSDSAGPTRALQLASLLECTRYFLMSKCFLLERLSCHPLVRSDARCIALVETIARYHSQFYLHTDWCPPAAMHREKNTEVNVLSYLVVSRVHQLRFGYYFTKTLFVFRLCTNQWLKFEIPSDISSKLEKTSQIHYQDDKIYFFGTNGSLVMFWPEVDYWEDLGQDRTLESPLCIRGDWIYSCCERQDGRAVVKKVKFRNLHLLPDAGLSWQQAGLLDLDEQTVLRITSIDNTLVIFCRSQDGISIVSFDSIHGTSNTIPTKLSLQQNDHFITLRKDSAVFVLEQNGYFWRLSRCSRSEDFVLVHESTLWQQENILRVCGALFARDELFVCFLKNEGEPDIPVSGSLEGVFNEIKLLVIPSDHISETAIVNATHAVIPDAVLHREEKKKIARETATYEFGTDIRVSEKRRRRH